jgi:hypothetical protein
VKERLMTMPATSPTGKAPVKEEKARRPAKSD